MQTSLYPIFGKSPVKESYTSISSLFFKLHSFNRINKQNSLHKLLLLVTTQSLLSKNLILTFLFAYKNSD